MSDTDQDQQASGFAKYKKILIPAALIFIAGGFGVRSAMQSDPTPSSSSTKVIESASSPNGRASLGGVNPSAEFNKTFADQLRNELVTKFDSERKAQRELLEAERLQQAAQLQSSLNTQKQEILDAIAAAKKQEPDVEVAVKKQIRAPSQPKVLPDAMIPSQTNPTDASLPGKQSSLVPVVAPTGFVRATMINGVVAQADTPRTFLARLEGEYISANGYRISLDGCMASIEGIADVSAGRIDGKPAVLTCNFDGGISKSWDLAGYVVDDDGIRGIRGITVNNLENKLIAGSLAGGISGLGEAIRQKQITQTASGTGGVATNITGSIGGVIGGSVLAGAGSNASRALAEVYGQYKTTIQTGAGTKFSITLLSELTVPREGNYITPLTARK